MKRKIVPALLIFVVACAGFTQNPDGTKRSPREIAELSYVTGSVGYEFAQEVVKAAEAAGKINDAQWQRYKDAERTVQAYAPIVRASLDLWRSTGVKPDSYDAAAQKLANARADATAVRVEVQP